MNPAAPNDRCPRLCRRAWLLCTAVAGLPLLTGCLNLKPRPEITRHLVLEPGLPASEPAPAAPSTRLAVGLGAIRLPAYLDRPAVVIRSGGTELRYAEDLRWAEPLDAGIARVLVVELARFRPGILVRSPAWRRADVRAELTVTIERFEVDEAGLATLRARWLVALPGGAGVVRSGTLDRSRPGPTMPADPAGAAATLGALLSELAREVAAALDALPSVAVSGRMER